MQISAGGEYLSTVLVKVVVDEQSFTDLSGYLEDMDGERVIAIDTLQEKRLRDLLRAAETASQPVIITFKEKRLIFPVNNIGPTLGAFSAGCL